MELKGMRVMVVGLGISGRAAARFIHQHGGRLVLTDTSADIARDTLAPGELRLGGEDAAWLDGVELVVVSPGVAPSSILMRAAAERHIPIVGELELASRFVTAPIVAITGTNGKSTVTTLVAEIFRAAGRQVFAGGNLGTPLIEAVGAEIDAAVVEVSSFQLETIGRFRPHVGVYLNLAEDHLDRYRDIDDYGRAKARMFMNQRGDDWAILNRDDARVWALRTEVKSRVIGFGHGASGGIDSIAPDGDELRFEIGGGAGRIGLAGLALAGAHNLANVMAGAAAALAMGVASEAIEAAIARFRGLPHRMETVCERGGVTFIDDSKGTNVAAVVEALNAVGRRVILLAGGVDKGGDYGPLRAPLAAKVSLLILFGAARETMRCALAGATRVEVVGTLAEAVRMAGGAARAGDVVMLSPACSSFDQFRNYAERGRIFQELVREL